MARELPWDTAKQPVSKSKIIKFRAKPKPKPMVESESDDEERSSGDSEGSISKVSKKKKVQSPTSTPEEKSEVDLMKEGLGHDDIYMMVEDEFLATAKKFTRQIHQAALEEMEKAAKLKSRETIADISRPVSIAMPSQTRRKLQGIARGKKQGHGVEKLLAYVPGGGDEEDNDDDPEAVPAWIGTSLHGLMEAPTKPTPSLARFGITKAAKTAVNSTISDSQSTYKPTSSRSSFAIIPQSSSFEKDDDDETASEDGNDLDAVPKAPKITRPTKTEPEPRKSLFANIKPRPLPSLGITTQSSMDRSLELKATVSSTLITADVPEPPPTSSVPASSMAQIRKRLAERRQRANS